MDYGNRSRQEAGGKRKAFHDQKAIKRSKEVLGLGITTCDRQRFKGAHTLTSIKGGTADTTRWRPTTGGDDETQSVADQF